MQRHVLAIGIVFVLSATSTGASASDPLDGFDAFAGNFECDRILCRRHGPSLFVDSFYAKNRDVFAIGVDLHAVGGQLDRFFLAGRLAFFGQHDFAVFGSAGFEHARLVFHFPLQMREGLHRLRPLTLAVEKNFD